MVQTRQQARGTALAELRALGGNHQPSSVLAEREPWCRMVGGEREFGKSEGEVEASLCWARCGLG